MLLRFNQEALHDLSGLDAYFSDKSPQGLRNVITAIKKNFDLIELFPKSGKETDVKNVRISIEPHYGYVIPYYLKGEEIWILRVYNARRAPLDYTNLILP
jgi:plasmid stabilization system protein ParE